VWIVTNWALDIIALMPFVDLTAWRYFVEIGFRYFGIFSTTIAGDNVCCGPSDGRAGGLLIHHAGGHLG
jgi:hypothetical protein